MGKEKQTDPQLHLESSTSLSKQQIDRTTKKTSKDMEELNTTIKPPDLTDICGIHYFQVPTQDRLYFEPQSKPQQFKKD